MSQFHRGMPRRKQKLVLLVLSQFAATSLWFAGNAIYADLQAARGFSFDLTPGLTIAVQAGFIVGTLTYALFTIPDRFSPAGVFFVSALLGAFFNLLLVFDLSYWSLYVSRFAVGFFLAGVYPVGMKIAADWAKESLGVALGFLVGALVLGTSFPHFLKSQSLGWSWDFVTYITSGLAIISGFIVLFAVGDGPARTKGKGLSFGAILGVFSVKKLRSSALGYFGHMWELYAFWAFLPAMLGWYGVEHNLEINQALWSFLIIGIGAVGCVIGGMLTLRWGSGRVAFISLTISASCGFLSVLAFSWSWWWFIAFLLIWGFFVIPDSPQFSSMVAQYAEKEMLGSTLTLVNCVGFALTIVSIEFMAQMEPLGAYRFGLLAAGPLLGLIPSFHLRNSGKK